MSMARLILALLFGLIVYINAEVRVIGGGSTLSSNVNDLLAKVYTETNSAASSFTYSAVGSLEGLKDLFARKIQYAATDVELEQNSYDLYPDVKQIPLMAAPIVVIYRFPHELNITGLVLDRETTVGIFDGSITMWNDPKIVALNSQYKDILPAHRIVRVVREDSSGVSDILTHAFSTFSESWKSSVGITPQPAWPKASEGYIKYGEGSQGVSKLVFQTEYSISYMSLRNAKENLHSISLLKNKAGTVLEASVAAAVSSMNDFSSQLDTKFFTPLVDGPGINSWPIVGFTYYVYRENNMTDCAKASELQKYFKWVFENAIFEAQTTASELITENHFAPNNKAINKLVLKKIYDMTCAGKVLDLGLKPVKTGGIAFGFFVLLCFIVVVIAAIVWFIKFKLQELIESRISK